jgi:RimJ/RimL family protein N-acetyltransferase
MKLVENIPLDTQAIADLIKDHGELSLVWPIAKYPFDHNQWREALNPAEGHIPFLVYENDQLIGHAALRITETPNVYAVSFLYLLPQVRSKGLGVQMVSLLAQYAKEKLFAIKLILAVRTYNQVARRCYLKCGFKEDRQDGTLIQMSKVF